MPPEGAQPDQSQQTDPCEPGTSNCQFAQRAVRVVPLISECGTLCQRFQNRYGAPGPAGGVEGSLVIPQAARSNTTVCDTRFGVAVLLASTQESE